MKQATSLLMQHHVGMYYTDYLSSTALTTKIQEQKRTVKVTTMFSTVL
jgi:hypothetical protein